MAHKRAPEQLTPLELEIMKVLWEAGPSTVQTVQRLLPEERRLAYTTVQTMLNVLHRKRRVKRALKDRAYHYRATQPRGESVRQLMGDIIDRVFGGSPESLVLSLVETDRLRPEQLSELLQAVNDADDAAAREADDDQ